MPSTTQIVPEHDYAHVMVVEHDNSQRANDSATSALETYCNMLFVFPSPKGVDGKLRTIETGFTGFKEDYGVGSMDDYGQAYLNAYNAARTNAATLHCMRVTADDATYAVGALVAHYKCTRPTGGTVFEPTDPDIEDGSDAEEEPPVILPTSAFVNNEGHDDIGVSDETDEDGTITIRVAGTGVNAYISERNAEIFGNVDDCIDITLNTSLLVSDLTDSKVYQVTQTNPALEKFFGTDEFITQQGTEFVKTKTYTGAVLREGYSILVGSDSTVKINISEYGIDDTPTDEDVIVINNTDLYVEVADTKGHVSVTADGNIFNVLCTGEVVSGTIHPELWGTVDLDKMVELVLAFPNIDESKQYTVVQSNPALENYAGDPYISSSSESGVTTWTKIRTYQGSDISDGYGILLTADGNINNSATVAIYEGSDTEAAALYTVNVTNEYTYVAEHTAPDDPVPEVIGDPVDINVISTIAFDGEKSLSTVLRARAAAITMLTATEDDDTENDGSNPDDDDNVQDEETGPTEGSLDIYFTFDGPDKPVTSADNLGTLVSVDDTIDEDGYQSVKLFEICCRGRGAYGNNIRFVLAPYARGDKTSNYKNYTLSVYEISKATLTKKEEFTISFHPDAVDASGNTLYADYIVADPYNNSNYITMISNPGAFALLHAMYLEAEPMASVLYEQFDPICGAVFGSSLNYLPNLNIDTTSQNTVSVSGASGIPLIGGDDGAFTSGRPGREDAINTAILKAYAGEIDENIYSRKIYPTDIILDAGFPLDIKLAISALVHKRKDCSAFYDIGTEFNSFEGLMEAVAELDTDVTTRDESIEVYRGKIQDPTTFKIVNVTSTYALAYMYPRHFQTHGAKHVPLAGSSYGTMSGFLSGSAYPVFDDDLHSVQLDKLSEAHLNYLKVNSLKQVVRGSQSTRQTEDTNLSECSNVFVLHDIRRDAIKLCELYEYNFAEATDLQRFNKSAAILAEKYAAAQVSAITAQFDMNDWESERGILHLYIEFVHKNIIKRAIVEIDINRGTAVA